MTSLANQIPVTHQIAQLLPFDSSSMCPHSLSVYVYSYASSMSMPMRKQAYIEREEKNVLRFVGMTTMK